MRRTETVDINFFSGSSCKSRKEPFVFCRFIFLALLSFLYCLPDVSENQVISKHTFRTSPALTISSQELTDSTDLLDDIPLWDNTNGRQKTCRRPSKTFFPDIPDTLCGNLNILITVQSTGGYIFPNFNNTYHWYKESLFVRAGPRKAV